MKEDFANKIQKSWFAPELICEEKLASLRDYRRY
jgi:hypothetical protein